MTNIAVVENKISSAQKYLNILGRYGDYSRKDLEENIDIRGAVERYLYLAIQASIDCAEALISLRKFRKPSTMAESFLILHEEGLISPEQKATMSKIVGFRNIMAHDYEEIDYSIVYEVLHGGLTDIKDFLDAVARSL